MKKTLIALAAIATTGVAFAQSNVTLYGRMDLGMSSSKTSSAGVTTAKATSIFGNQGGNTSARLGVKGWEDLGGGLKAGFNYELGLNMDRGDIAFSSGTGVGKTRKAYLSLQGGFGSVSIGNQSNVIDTVRWGYTIDPASRVIFGVTGDVAPGVVDNQNILDADDENLLLYTSPKMNGFTFSAGLSSEKKSTALRPGGATSTADVINPAVTAPGPTVTGTNTQKLNSTQFGLKYAAGPLSLAFAYRNLKNVNFDGTTAANVGYSGRATNWGFQAGYEFPMVTPYFIYESVKNRGVVTIIGNTPQNKGYAWSLGAAFPMGQWEHYVQLDRGQATLVNTTPLTVKNKYSSYELGTSYFLSKRTRVYGAINSYTKKADVTAATPTKTRMTAYAVGLRHDF